MTIDVVRILLLDEDEKTYLLIHNLLNQIKTAQFQLQWIVSPDQDLAASQHYQVYLIDAQRLIKAEINSAEDLETLQQACRTLTAQVGLVALQAGAADYLEKDLTFLY